MNIYDFSYYWYYLADAQFKANQFEDALLSIDKALTSKFLYPSKEKIGSKSEWYMGEDIRRSKRARAVLCDKQYRAFIYEVYGVC